MTRTGTELSPAGLGCFPIVALFRQSLQQARADLSIEEIDPILHAALCTSDEDMNMMQMDAAIRKEWMHRGYAPFWPKQTTEEGSTHG